MPSSTQRFLTKLFANGYSEIGARRAIEHFRWPADVVTVAKRVVALWFTKKAKRDVDVDWLANYVTEVPATATPVRAQPKAAPVRKAPVAQAAPAKAPATRGRTAKVPAQPAAPAARKRPTVQMLDQVHQDNERVRKDPNHVTTQPIFGGSSRTRVLRPAEMEMLAVAVDISTIAKNTAEGLRALGESPESDARRTAHQALIWSADWLQFFRAHILVYMQKEGMISEADLATAQASLAAEPVKPLASSKAPVKAPVRPAKPAVVEEDADDEEEDEDDEDDGGEDEEESPSVEDDEEAEDAGPEATDTDDEDDDEEDNEGDSAEVAAALDSEDDSEEEPASEPVGAPRPARSLA